MCRQDRWAWDMLHVTTVGSIGSIELEANNTYYYYYYYYDYFYSYLP